MEKKKEEERKNKSKIQQLQNCKVVERNVETTVKEICLLQHIACLLGNDDLLLRHTIHHTIPPAETLLTSSLFSNCFNKSELC
eukprot:m.153449 g.153449  ORF g.153449 m.153449 type:complete len:83 (+) comp16233_c3_seq4:867-1115(+)